MRKMKRLFLLAVKYTGLFHVSRALNGKGIRVLCYHGLSLEDEADVDGYLFIRESTFLRRMALIRKWNMQVIPLHVAVGGVAGYHYPRNSVVLTFDDGWRSTYLRAMPIVEKYRWPLTIYVATYYAMKQQMVFNVLIRYLLRKRNSSRVGIRGWGHEIDGDYLLDSETVVRRLLQAIIELAETPGFSPESRDELARQLAAELDVDLTAIERAGMFHFVNLEEMQDLLDRGADLQLHTHRHRFPQEPEQLAGEILDNRTALQTVRERGYVDFCYPSGNYHQELLPWLRDLGVRSATTCAPGFNYPGSCPYQLGRFLDGEPVSDLEFEAELCGVLEIMRKLTGRATPWKGADSPGKAGGTVPGAQEDVIAVPQRPAAERDDEQQPAAQEKGY